MQDLERFFNPNAISKPETPAELALVLEELESALVDLNAALGEFEEILKGMRD